MGNSKVKYSQLGFKDIANEVGLDMFGADVEYIKCTITDTVISVTGTNGMTYDANYTLTLVPITIDGVTLETYHDYTVVLTSESFPEDQKVQNFVARVAKFPDSYFAMKFIHRLVTLKLGKSPKTSSVNSEKRKAEMALIKAARKPASKVTVVAPTAEELVKIEEYRAAKDASIIPQDQEKVKAFRKSKGIELQDA